ncbi:importin-4 [Mytilus galloprovincialis]|uniref:Importin-4 n=1 Tax=Mytilus galloprovincialis TaxID=29158 RepID=A0A8B6HG14_MYTGA|nr:importin-4 [Mytilus galloprovincialis]
MNGNRNGSTKSLSEQNSCTDMNKKGQTSDMTDDKLDANKTADIEEQLGKLPDFLSDDEKAETKPVIKQEPMGPVLCAADFDRLREVIRHDTYTHCDVHKLERMERNVVCIQCQQLICALCLLNSHQSHDIRSVSSMNEYFNVKVRLTVESCLLNYHQSHDIRSVSSMNEYFEVKGTIEEDVSVLQQEQNNLTVKFAQRKELKKKIESVVKRILEIVQEDTDRTVVMTAIDTLYEMLEKIGRPVLDVQGATGAILARMKEAFTNKLSCQDEDTLEDDDQQAEFDGMLIESAGDVLPVMAKLLGGDIFLPFFRSFLVDLLKRLKETSSVSEKSFAVGTLAETLLACGQVSVNFVDPLYPLFMKMIRDEDEEVRSNSIFALGVLMANSGDKLFSYPFRQTFYHHN